MSNTAVTWIAAIVFAIALPVAIRRAEKRRQAFKKHREQNKDEERLG